MPLRISKSVYEKRDRGNLCALANQSVAEVRPVADAIDDERVAGRDAVLQHLLGDTGDPRFLDDRSGKIARVILEQGLVDPEDFTGPTKIPRWTEPPTSRDSSTLPT